MRYIDVEVSGSVGRWMRRGRSQKKDIPGGRETLKLYCFRRRDRNGNRWLDRRTFNIRLKTSALNLSLEIPLQPSENPDRPTVQLYFNPKCCQG
ncbi:hypothetical protein [Baaleninema sp.]|uniref:hypothetical protein n=1 Tax=Baaleninema sp. TaxID=3101197 RepID=UPI003CFD4E72